MKIRIPLWPAPVKRYNARVTVVNPGSTLLAGTVIS